MVAWINNNPTKPIRVVPGQVPMHGPPSYNITLYMQI